MSLLTQAWWVIAVGIMYFGTSYLSQMSYENAYGTYPLAWYATAVISIIIWFKLAIKSHHNALISERPDATSINIPIQTKAKFIGVALLVILVAILVVWFVGLLLGMLTGDAFWEFLFTAFIAFMSGNATVSFSYISFAIIIAALTAFSFILTSPFMPRVLTSFHRPFRSQVRVNMFHWRHAMRYYLIGPIIIWLLYVIIEFCVGTIFSLAYIGDASIQYTGSLYGAVWALFAGVLHSALIIAASTAFSMHFLDTISDDELLDISSP